MAALLAHLRQVQRRAIGQLQGAQASAVAAHGVAQAGVLKAHVSHQHLRAVGGGGRGLAILDHTVCGRTHHVVAGQLDFGQAQIGQAAHFARVAHAVLVGVLPHHELAKLRILRVELAVMVGVKRRRQALQVGVATVLRKGVLAVVVHHAVGKLVPHQHAVLRAGPWGGVHHPVAIDVHHHTAVADRTVPVQVDNHRGGIGE